MKLLSDAIKVVEASDYFTGKWLPEICRRNHCLYTFVAGYQSMAVTHQTQPRGNGSSTMVFHYENPWDDDLPYRVKQWMEQMHGLRF